MKMKPEDYEKLKEAVWNLPVEVVDNLLFLSAKSEERFRWSLFHEVNSAPDFPFRHLQMYLNDSHINTALHSIVKGK